MTRRRHDPTDADAVKTAQDQVQVARRRYLEELRADLETPAGRRRFLLIIERAGVFKVSFDNSGSITAKNEGMRLIGLMYWADLEEIGGLRFYEQALQEAKHSQGDA